MIITKVTIYNFKIYKYKEFNFGESKMILLTGANGFGKTTLIDAIEWCFTGDIGRLKKHYEERNTTQAEIERKENKNGIIKHSNSNEREMVKVEVTLKIGNDEVKIYREQKEDSLYVNTELKFIGNVSSDIKERIIESTSKDIFYNYHVCDTSKSYDFLNSRRQEVKSHFEDFIKSYPLAERFIEKLTEVQKQIKEDIEKLENQKIPENTINIIEREVSTIKSDLKSIDYPQIKFYEEENLEIEEENIEKIKEQLEKIKTCGYNTVAEKMESVMEYYKAKENREVIENLINEIDAKEEKLQVAIENQYYNIDKLNKIKDNIQKVKNEKTKIEKAKRLAEIDMPLDAKIYSEIDEKIKKQNDIIVEIENEWKLKQVEIKEKEEGNEIIKALTALVTNREGIIKYKQENENRERCPLCGSSEVFSGIIESKELAIDAEIYLERSNTNLLQMKKAEQKIMLDINEKFNRLKSLILQHLDNQLDTLQKRERIFSKYYNETKNFFEMLKEANIIINENCIDQVKERKTRLIKILSNEKMINSYLDMIKKILILLNYNENLDSITTIVLEKIKIEIATFCNKMLIVSNFTFDVFNQKILFLNNILNNQKICQKEEQLKKYNEENKKIDIQIKKLKEYENKAKKRCDQIKEKKRDIEKLELKDVGAYLYKIFTKVIKHTTITKFNFNRDNSRVAGGATFTDQNGNNIFNILSQGQLGAFILSYFFGNMFKRRGETQFKVYFVDDITSAMDDMNVLSFVDIIKYQLYRSKDGVIDQLFFATCDNDLERLFIHKMESFGIDMVIFRFYSYGRYMDMNTKMNN